MIRHVAHYPREAWSQLRVVLSGRPAGAFALREAARAAASACDARIRVRCVIFSKDRAMQLDACLRSIFRHAPYEGEIVVLYRASSEFFASGYRTLVPDEQVALVEEGADFRQDVLRIVGDDTPFTVFHTDDDLFFRRPPLPPSPPDDCACFSLRLGTNTTYCYPYGTSQAVPRVEECGEVMAWNWRGSSFDFSYPMSLNGHVFNTERLRLLLHRATFRDPNSLERELHLQRHRMPPIMLSFTKSVLVTIPANIVTESIVNRSANDAAYSPHALNERFLRGDRIDLDDMDLSDPHASHLELPLAFSNPRHRSSM